MGQHFNFAPAVAGLRQRDDYGAVAGILSPACFAVSLLKSIYRTSRSFPVMQPRKVVATGRLNHVAR
ncbi:hypothetical protein ED28_14955 [[Pantoea] beijingensis]|uniref:Uncharacterized protein n=1 Tax=[Pantoea] beijingensis TaxID=1324864 RepID=A0A443IAM3_9GAMM|nr:hypothetical protein ED28_14955 [[Pantoea] beijingensis]